MPVFRTFGDDGGRSGVDWEAVCDEYLPRVYNYFRYLVGSQAVAEDLTAAVFEKAWRRRDRYRADRGVLSTWLFALAKNVAQGHFRRGPSSGGAAGMGRGNGRPRAGGGSGGGAGGAGPAWGRCWPGCRAERELVALKYGAGLTNREIARLTGLSETNVGTILHRVVQRLREQWEEEP